MFVDFGSVIGYVVNLATQAKQEFRELLATCGYGEKVSDALWLWYDFSVKKGVASF
jgi:hypothetical protein